MPEPFDPIQPHQHKINIRFVLQPDGTEKMDAVTLHTLMYHLAQDTTSHCRAGVGKLYPFLHRPVESVSQKDMFSALPLRLGPIWN